MTESVGFTLPFVILEVMFVTEMIPMISLQSRQWKFFDNKRYHNSLPIFADDRHLLKVVLTEDFDGVVAGEVRFYSDSFWVVKHTDWLVPPPSRREVRGCGDRTIEVILTICPRHPPLCRDPGTR